MASISAHTQLPAFRQVTSHEARRAMASTDLLMKAMLALALFAAAILGILWLVFTCKELWQMHTLAKLSRTHESRRG